MRAVLWKGASDLAKRVVAKAEAIGIDVQHERRQLVNFVFLAAAVAAYPAYNALTQEYQNYRVRIVGNSTSCPLPDPAVGTKYISYQTPYSSLSMSFSLQDNAIDGDWQDFSTGKDERFKGYALLPQGLDWSLSDKPVGSLAVTGLDPAAREIVQRAVQFCAEKNRDHAYTQITAAQQRDIAKSIANLLRP